MKYLLALGTGYPPVGRVHTCFYLPSKFDARASLASPTPPIAKRSFPPHHTAREKQFPERAIRHKARLFFLFLSFFFIPSPIPAICHAPAGELRGREEGRFILGKPGLALSSTHKANPHIYISYIHTSMLGWYGGFELLRMCYHALAFVTPKFK